MKQKLTQQQKKPLHQNQREFIPGSSTLHNLNDLCQYLQQAKALALMDKRIWLSVNHATGIKTTGCVTYLGIIIDDDLSFRSEIKSISD